MTETQTAALFDPPTEPRELIRHYTLSAGDLAIVHRCRGEHNRLGCALMLCYLRYPGRPLRAGERPPAELTAFVAEQIDAPPTAIEAYLAAERNRQTQLEGNSPRRRPASQPSREQNRALAARIVQIAALAADPAGPSSGGRPAEEPQTKIEINQFGQFE